MLKINIIKKLANVWKILHINNLAEKKFHKVDEKIANQNIIEIANKINDVYHTSWSMKRLTKLYYYQEIWVFHSSNKITRYNNNNNNNNIIISHHVFRILFIPRNFMQSISNFVQLLNISIKKNVSFHSTNNHELADYTITRLSVTTPTRSFTSGLLLLLFLSVLLIISTRILILIIH